MKGKCILQKSSFQFKGLNFFGLIITTKRAVMNININCDEVLIMPIKSQRNRKKTMR